MNVTEFIIVDGRQVAINGERNLLEIIRKAGIDIPTFCYHSELSVYGACRLCLVDIEGRGIVTSCSTAPEAGMRVRTQTAEIREIRRITIELLLADHQQSCPTCSKSAACQLQALGRRLGIESVRFKSTRKSQPVDRSTPSLVRDPNKCVLCGDCVRMCSEVQSIGAIDFANRGSAVTVQPAFGKDLAQVECVYCGQCARVCPTGALVPASHVDEVWAVLEDPGVTVVAQIAPAVRVALGEMFGLPAGSVVTGQLAAALKALGFDQVYDTCLAADMTVLEEATEFIGRFSAGKRLPQFTSCCPAWVKFAEQYYPQLLENLSSCRSPQQMFGSLGKDILPALLNVPREKLVIVSIMPCTAKKFEARRPEFADGGKPDVDFVLTTQELGLMIEQGGLRLDRLEPASLSMPLGFKTGAGIIFGNSGGVSEAVLRYAGEKLEGVRLDAVEFNAVRGEAGLREATVKVGGLELRLAIVHGLRNARRIAEEAKAGTCKYDLVEVMACPGGCVGGAGQPFCTDAGDVRRKRTKALYDTDRTLQLHKSQDNHIVADLYTKRLGDIGGSEAHRLLHTRYQSRRRLDGQSMDVLGGTGAASVGDCQKIQVNVCVGTSCYVRGSHDLLRALVEHIRTAGLESMVDVQATFCFEKCDNGPSVSVGGTVLKKARLENVVSLLQSELAVGNCDKSGCQACRESAHKPAT